MMPWKYVKLLHNRNSQLQNKAETHKLNFIHFFSSMNLWSLDIYIYIYYFIDIILLYYTIYIIVFVLYYLYYIIDIILFILY